MSLELTSPKFDNGGEIPRKYGYNYENVNPPLKINGVPDGTESLVLVVDDPDAKEPAGKVWTHWVMWNIEPNTTFIYENGDPPGAVEGKNDYGKSGYGGPNPPDKEHTYRFMLFALDTSLDLRAPAGKSEVQKAMKGHVLEKVMLKGTYAP
ncbi:MAG: YbhB/YbcL family Raf kinase inhibitor-like protein [Thermoplasmata archaeon]